MDHDRFIARCKYLVTDAHRALCHEPDDELRPFLFILPPGTDSATNVEVLPIPPWMMQDGTKAPAFEKVAEEFLRPMGVRHVGFASEAWYVRVPGDSGLAAYAREHRELPEDQMPRNRSDRVEMVQLFVATAQMATAHQAEIVRPLVGRPALKAWLDMDPVMPDDDVWVGQLAEPLRQAVLG